MDVSNIQKRSEKDRNKIQTKNYPRNIQKHPKTFRKTSEKHSKTSKKHPKNIRKTSKKELWNIFRDMLSLFAFYLMATYLHMYIIIIYFAILCGSEIFPSGEI